MSWQASKYARELLEADDVELSRSARLVLMLCAERAGSRTGYAIGGAWLARSASLCPANVRKALHELAAAGAVALDSRPPRPLGVRFPTVAHLSTTRADARGSELADPRATAQVPARSHVGTRAQALAVPHRTEYVPQREHRPLCADSCPSCEGAGFVADAEGRFEPCPERIAS